MNNETIKAEIARIREKQSRLNREYAQKIRKLDIKLKEIRAQCPHTTIESYGEWQECLVCGETFELLTI